MTSLAPFRYPIVFDTSDPHSGPHKARGPITIVHEPDEALAIVKEYLQRTLPVLHRNPATPFPVPLHYPRRRLWGHLGLGFLLYVLRNAREFVVAWHRHLFEPGCRRS